MKLLFDENLSPELVEALADTYRDSQHVHDRGLGASDDRDVWEYAKFFGFAIVTKDADFYERSMRVGAPPKVIWLRLGNCTTVAVEMLLRNSEQAMIRFERSKCSMSLFLHCLRCRTSRFLAYALLRLHPSHPKFSEIVLRIDLPWFPILFADHIPRCRVTSRD